MNRDGHVGAALAAYSPIGYVAASSGYPTPAVIGAGVTVALATLPDVDVHLPLVAHRGLTHTVWFALLVAAACAAVGRRVAGSVAFAEPPEAAAFGAAVGATTVCSHLVVDALTPMGVRPFAPFGSRVTVRLVRASNRVANRLLFGTGVGVLVATLWVASRPW